MKRFIIALIAIILFASPPQAQVFVGLSAGVTQQSPLATLQLGYDIPSNTEFSLYAGYDQRISVGQKANVPSWFGVNAGLFFELTENSKFAPLTGYYYRQVSSEYTNLNGWDIGAGVTYIRVPLSLEIYYLGRTCSVTVGWVGFLSNSLNR